MIARTSMPLRLPAVSLLLVTLGAFAGSAPGRAPVAPNLLSGLVWRNLGPFRGGGLSAGSGAPRPAPGLFNRPPPRGGLGNTPRGGNPVAVLLGATPPAPGRAPPQPPPPPT